jgi:hypothetical protein
MKICSSLGMVLLYAKPVDVHFLAVFYILVLQRASSFF